MDINKQEQSEKPDDPQSTIFTGEEFSTADYERKIRNARTAIFIVGFATLILGIVEMVRHLEEANWIELFINIAVAGIFIGLGFWTKKRPYAAIVTALCVYIGLIILVGILQPDKILNGILVKMIIIFYLIKGLSNAKDAEQIRETIGN